MKTLNLIARDHWLEPFSHAINGRYEYALRREKELTVKAGSLRDFANGYLYFGLHKTSDGWVFREYAPNATAIFLVGDFNDWQQRQEYQLKAVGNGVWEGKFPTDAIHHNEHFKLMMHWNGWAEERIPAWANRVVQDWNTRIFSAQVWAPEKQYQFKNKSFTPAKEPLFIYECHIGMSSEEGKVATYSEFRTNVLPRVVKAGYNCIQIMAVQEHPYYGSFGYHVANFFAVSSRCGTPEELKELIDEAHKNGVAVIMDIVHSHSVKNTREGLGYFDGTRYLYFHDGARGEHPAWDSLCFDYGKDNVIHFLLSNCRYWMEEYGFDGFRFDGVTSMLYLSHGLNVAFNGLGDYFNGNQDGDAICYLTLANKLIHEINPSAITIAEEVSGMPGTATRVEDGGIGFDYRLAMGIPDFWIKTIKEVKDEFWNAGHILWQLTNRRADEKTISYAESHDQALVGDQTIIFRLIGADMYWHMKKSDCNHRVDRGLALHKLIRLITSSTMNGGYLNFMGNEFGHPEWIDFPREGNGWSHHYARRQWSLVDNHELKYHWLGDFDRGMVELIKKEKDFEASGIVKVWDNQGDQVLAYKRNDLLFVFNFSPFSSYSGYGIAVDKGKYKVELNSESKKFGGGGWVEDGAVFDTAKNDDRDRVYLNLPSRSALVLKKIG